MIFGSGDGAADTGTDIGLLTAFGVVMEAVVTATDLAVCRLKGLR